MRGCFIFIFTVVFCNFCRAQQVHVDADLSAESLIENVLAQGCVGVSNVVSPVNGSDFGYSSFGSFTRGDSNFPFENGIVISTGDVRSSGNIPIENTLNEGVSEWGGDLDLEAALQVQNTMNATTLEFDFVAVSNRIAFNYLFASEEYEGVFSCDARNADSFVFLIKEMGVNSDYRNIALIPNTSIPVNTGTIRPEIEGYCSANNEAYFEGYHLGDTNFNGRTAVMTATADIIPYTSYHIKLIIADQSDRFYDSAVFIEGKSFSVPFDLGEAIETCASSVELTADVGNTAAQYSWYRNNQFITTTANTSIEVFSSGDYSVQAEVPIGNASCIIEDSISVIVHTEQELQNEISDYKLCDTNNTGDLVEVFDVSSKNSEILDALPTGNFVISYHLSDAEARNNSNSITGFFENTSESQEIYIRAENIDTGCLSFGSFHLEVTTCYATGSFVNWLHEIPIIENIPNTIAMCLVGSLTLTANSSDTDSYQWYLEGVPMPLETTQDIVITEPGSYKLEVISRNGCMNTKNFSVTSASFVRVDVTHFTHPNQVTVVISGPGEYQYELEGNGVQDENIFRDVPVGVYTIDIYQEQCETFRSPVFYLLNYPTFFTPNEDGINDRWHLLGIENSNEIKSAIVSIYDRYGNIVARISEDTLGWDGRDADGNNMPTNDYWFAADVTINRQHHVVKGHFSLLR